MKLLFPQNVPIFLTDLYHFPVCVCAFRLDAGRTAASVGDIHRHAGIAERSQPPMSSLVIFLNTPHHIHLDPQHRFMTS